MPSHHHRTRRTVGPLLSLIATGCAATLLLHACSSDEPSRDPPALGPRNVLLVSFDTTRADALGCYGGTRGCSPHIDALAEEGVVFEHAFSPVPLTLPSHTTMLTGLDPTRHSVRDNSVYKVPGEAQTLAEALKEETDYYSIAAVGSIILGESYDLGQGFDVYDDGDLATEKDRSAAERPAAAVVDAFLSHLEAAPEGRPWFGFVHFYDPHHPVLSPRKYLEPYSGDRRDLYFGEIAYTDAQLGRLLDALQERGEFENTLIVFTSDHGEARGEHGAETHGNLVHDATMRVPLILRHRDLEPRRVDDHLVSLCDLMPTILDWLGADSEQNPDGRSLLPLTRGEALSSPGDTYLESLMASLAFDFAPVDAVRNLQWKLVKTSKTRLFDMQNDPGELHDVSAEHPELVEELSQRLRALRDREVKLRSDTLVLSSAERAVLGNLGYVPAVTEERAAQDDRSGLADPYDATPDLVEYERAVALRRTNQPKQIEEATHIMEGLVSRYPHTYQFHESLGTFYGRLARPSDALREFREAEKIHPDSADLWLNIATAAGASWMDGNDPAMRDTAVEYLSKTIEKGGETKAYFMLAELYGREGNRLGAQGVLQRLLQRKDIPADVRSQAMKMMQ